MKRAKSCGIDVGLKSHTVCLMDEDQESISKYTILNDIDGFTRIARDIDKKTFICLEPTGVYSINIFIYFKKHGYDIRFCKPISSSYARKASIGKKKHDKLDCIALARYRLAFNTFTFDGTRLLSKLVDQNNYKDNKKYLDLVHILGYYTKKKKQMATLKTKIKNMIDLRFPEAIQIFPYDRGCKTMLKALCHSKEDILRGKIKLKKLLEIKEKIKVTIGQYDFKAAEFKDSVEELDILEKEIKDLRTNIKEHLYGMGYSCLFNYPGLDTINIAVLVTEIKDIRKFFKYNKNTLLNKKRSLKAFKEFMGIAVTSNQSGNHEGGHKLVKSGNMKLRTTLYMLVLTYISLKDKEDTNIEEYKELDPYRFKNLYNKLVDNNVKKKIAITKVMNKIATDLFFILKDVEELREKS